MDIAPLGFFVDTSGLVAGQKAVDQFVQNVGRAGDTVDKFGNNAKVAGQEAGQAAAGVNRMGQAAQQAAQQTGQLNDRAGGAIQRLKDMVAGFRGAGTAGQSFGGSMGGVGGMLRSATADAAAMAQSLGLGGLTGALGGATQGAGALSGGMMALGRVFGPVGIAVASLASSFIALSSTLADNQDRWNQYRQRLGVAFNDFDEGAASVARIADMANRLGVNMDTAMQSFQRFANVRTSIGASTQDLETMTEAIMKIGLVSGTSQGEMQGAMLQFSQALAAGRLNGDELRSIMESMQPLLQELAKGMGVTTGELRKMGAEGELTSDKIFDALMSRIDEIDERYEQIDGTTQRTATAMANQWDELLANLGEALNSSESMQSVYGGIASLIGEINALLRDTPDTVDSLTAKIESRMRLAGLASLLPGLGTGVSVASSIGAYSAQQDLDALRNAPAAAANEMQQMVGMSETLAGRVRATTDEYLKQQDALKQLNTAHENIQTRLEDIAELEAMARREMVRAEEELRRNQATITFLQVRANNGDEEATAALEQMRERMTEAETALENVDRWRATLIRALDTVNERMEDAATGGLSKIRREITALNDAMAAGGGGLVQIYQQAAEIVKRARESSADGVSPVSMDEAIGVLLQQARGRAAQRIAEMEATASNQSNLASRLLAGADRNEAEAQAEAMTWAYNQFGDALSQNMDVVNDYTQALLRMKQAQQAVADAAEIDAIQRSIRGAEASLGVVGMGSYAERLSQLMQDQSEFLKERGAMINAATAAPAAAASGGPVDMATLIATVRHLESRNRDYGANGAPLRSSAGALFAMQVMPGTAAAPGYGIRPAASRTPGEYNRVGEEYIRALYGQYGDSASALAAYNWGPGNFEAARRRYGDAWMSHAPAETQSYVRNGLARMGGGGAAGATGMSPADLTSSAATIISGQREAFRLQELARTNAFLAQTYTGAAANQQRAGVAGDEVAARELDLRLRIADAIKGYAPEDAVRVENAIRVADAAQRELEARRDLAQATRGNDERARRIGAMGDAGAERQLELQLQIERIRRENPAGATRDALEAEARRGFNLDEDEVFARGRASREQRVRDMAREFELAQYYGDELEVQSRILDRQNELREAGIDLTSERAQEELRLEESLARQEVLFNRQLDQAMAIRDAFLRVAEEIGDGFAETFSRAFREGELRAKTMMRAIEDAFYNLLDAMMQQLVISPLVDALKGVLSSISGQPGKGNGILGFITSAAQTYFGGGFGGGAGGPSVPGFAHAANGGIFGGPLTAYAGGGIINSPTRFRHAGGAGLAGEGPGVYEAIMPLRRGPDGRLGVAAGGGGGGNGTVVNIMDMRSAGGSDAVEVQERENGNGQRQIDILIRDAVKGHIQAGAFDSDNREVYGIKRAVARR